MTYNGVKSKLKRKNKNKLYFYPYIFLNHEIEVSKDNSKKFL